MLMTPQQLRMALAADGRPLRIIADHVGVHESQISRAKHGRIALDFMRRMELYFTGRGVEFTQRDGRTLVDAPDPLPED